MQGPRDVDRGWAWVILLTTSMGHLIKSTILITLGLLQVEFVKVFSNSSSVTGLLSSLVLGLQLIPGPLVGLSCNVFGIRKTMMAGGLILAGGFFCSVFTTDIIPFLITFSVLGGTGLGICFTCLNVILGYYFTRRLAIASGIAYAMSGVGLALGPYPVIWLLNNVGWRYTILLLACVSLQMCVIGSTYFPQRQLQHVQKRTEATGTVNTKLWFLGHPYWWLICINYAFQMVGWGVQIIQFPLYAKAYNISSEDVQTLLLTFGLTTSVIRVFAGILCNDDSSKLLIIWIAVQGLQGIVTILMPVYGRGYGGLVAYQTLVGIFYGASFVPVTPVVVQLFSVERLPTVFGWMLMWGGAGCLAGPVIAGWLFDWSNSHSMGFHVAGLLEICGCVSLFLIPLIKQNYPQPSEFPGKQPHQHEVLLGNDKDSDETKK